MSSRRTEEESGGRLTGTATVVVTPTIRDYVEDLVAGRDTTALSLETLVVGSDETIKTAIQRHNSGSTGTVAETAAKVIDLLRRNELPLDRLNRIVAVMPRADDNGFATDLAYIFSKADKRPELWIVTDQDLPDDTRDRIPARRFRTVYSAQSDSDVKGVGTMGNRSDNYIQRPDELKRLVDETIRAIHDDMDPLEMNAYRRFIKQNVSVFSRGYFTAYLLRELARRDGIFTGRGRTAVPTREDQNTERSPEGNVPVDKRQTLFVSVGKNRRVYPKDFLALFTELEEVDGEMIGQIKILDNYSFVEVSEDIAPTIISAFDGYEFRGRKLTVNHARNKK